MSMSSESSSDPALPALRTAGLIAGAEALLLFVNGVVVGISALHSQGSIGSTPTVAPLALTSIFIVFAVAVGAVCRGLLKGSRGARTPFMLIQVFVLISAYTLMTGQAGLYQAIGLLVAVLGIAGLAMGVISIIRDSPEE